MEIDGYDKTWENGLRSDWESELGDHEYNDVVRFEPNFAMSRLNNPGEVRNYDTSGLGVGTDIFNDDTLDHIDDVINETSCVSRNVDTSGNDFTYVFSIDQDGFCSKLVSHFDIMFQKNMIVWPSYN